MPITTEYEDLIGLTDSKLLHELGLELLPDFARGGMKTPATDFINVAKNWLLQHNASIQSSACSSPQVRSYYETGEKKDLFLAVADVVAGMSLGVSPFLVAALLLRRGIGSFCADVWEVKG